ncbi:MAG: M13 family metallopeptidase N-terminal domain-containing protein, partial [Alistipes sp.]|nr:M13 family metallopeptidase N-terminal domain-containing protein [Alistipes sp.]
MKKFLILSTVALMMISCAGKQATTPAIDLTDFDTTVNPADDFYNYATGGWQKKHPLKPEYSRYGSFDMLRENNEIRINELFKEMTSMETEEGSINRRICDLYKLGLDADRLNKGGAAPIQEDLQKIMSVEREGLVELLAEIHLSVANPFFATFVESDMKNSDMNALYVWQSGLMMGNRDYYLDEANAELKGGYELYLQQILKLAGFSEEQALKGALETIQ